MHENLKSQEYKIAKDLLNKGGVRILFDDTTTYTATDVQKNAQGLREVFITRTGSIVSIDPVATAPTGNPKKAPGKPTKDLIPCINTPQELMPKEKKDGLSPSKRKKGYISIDVGGGGILLTKKQAEFLYRMPEDECFDHDTDSEVFIDNYADTLSDTMNRMTVGAMITTLREKKLITVYWGKIGGSKTKFFKLTSLGKSVYEEFIKRC